MQEILIAAISAVPPIIATIATTLLQAKTIARNAAKESIIQMIMEDHLAHHEGKLPTNYQNVLHEFDIYTKKGGNSYVHDKVEEYKAWFHEIEARKDDKTDAPC